MALRRGDVAGPHVALCLPNLCGGGAERSTVQIANGLARRGYRVDLVVLQRRGPYLNEVACGLWAMYAGLHPEVPLAKDLAERVEGLVKSILYFYLMSSEAKRKYPEPIR